MLIRLLLVFIVSLAAIAAPKPSSLLIQQQLRFEPNRGQAQPGVLYTAHAADAKLALLKNEAVVSLGGSPVRIKPLGANPAPVIEPEGTLPSRSNYYLGNRADRWQTNVPHFSRVRYRQIYPNIDLVFHGRSRLLEYDFIVAPQANPKQIRLQFPGAQSLSIDKSGDLLVKTGESTLRQPVPYAYQETASGRQQVKASYKLVNNSEVAFAVAAYDKGLPLVIDPVITATYLGGTNADFGAAVAADPQGGWWVCGYTTSDAFPLWGGPYKDAYQISYDIFVAHFNPDLTLDYSTYLGGDGDDRATAIAVDAAGQAYITGFTASTNFPLAGGSYQNSNAGQRDMFVAKFNLSTRGDATLWYSTYLGGTKDDVANAIALAPEGDVYIAGYSISGDFPLVGGSLQPSNRGGYEAVMARVDTLRGSDSVRYTTYLGGASTDVGTAIAVGPNNQVYFAGYTASDDFPVAGNALQPTYNGLADTFLAYIDLNRSGLDAYRFATYLGGSATDFAYGLVRDSNGRLFLTGYTTSSDFPVTPGAIQASKSLDSDVFLTRIDTDNNTPVRVSYSTFLGGASSDIAYGLAVDNAGHVAISGYTYSNDFPRSANALQREIGGGYDGFVSVIDTNTAGPAGLLFSTFYGGPATEVVYEISFDNRGNLGLAGFSTSTRGVSFGNVLQPSLAGMSDLVIGRYNLCDIAGFCAQ